MRKTMLAASALFLIVGLPTGAPAQDNQQEGSLLEEIVTTGSYIRRKTQFDSPSPIEIIGADDIAATGAKNIGDIAQTLTINTGSENNPDAFTQNSTTGSSNFNLRGLGVSSTLVLLNGQRQVLMGLPTNSGLNFVDTSSLVPMIAVASIEILKDGAAALYGSDAVAGVVNFKTRDDFEGLELSGDYQYVADEGDSSEFVVQALMGAQGDRGSLIAAMSYTERTPLTTLEKRLSRPIDDASVLGMPGSYFGVPGIPPGVPLIDPTGCESVGGIPAQLAPTLSPLIGFCQFDFGDYFNLIPDETRFSGFARGTFDIVDNVQLTGEFGYGRNRVIRGNSPTFPILTFPTVPASNPGNPFGVPVAFFGRAIGNGGEVSNSFNELNTWRGSVGLSGDLANDWYWEMTYVGAKNESVNDTRDTLAQEFQDALNGFGGVDCSGPTNPATLPGVGACEYFNPFATNFSVLPNSQNVLDSIFARQVLDTTSELQSAQAVLTGDIFEMASGPVGLAFGAAYRQEKLSHDYNSLANQDRFAFVIGNPDFFDVRDVTSVFAEVAVPLAERLDLQLAVRYEDYGGSVGNSTDPKVALIYSATDNLTLRGSFSTAFRAPSLFQSSGGSTSLNQVSDPLNPGGAFFASIRSSANPSLVPEESDAYNLGTSFTLGENLEIDLDYWRFEFTDVIIQESFQAVINADPSDTTRVVRAAGPGTPIIQVNVGFVNASSVETDGIDFKVRYNWDTGLGTFQPFVEGTYILSYDLQDPQAGSVDGAGLRNFNNFGTSTPELRFNAGFGWLNGAHAANLFVRYIDGYDDDQNCSDGTGSSGGSCPAGVSFFEVEDHVTVDAQYSLDLPTLTGRDYLPTLTVGGINLTGEDPPQLFTNGGFDSKVHDPRGRMVYVRAVVSFE